MEIISLNESQGRLSSDPELAFNHPYPPTKLMFIPDREGSRPDLLASSGDFLRVWRIASNGVGLERLLNPATSPKHASPLTSFDWNDIDVRRIGTSSIDTTCTIWDVERGSVEAQIIAHDREVYDFAWGGAGVFASVSADGSVRVFDLRDKEHSTIVYESPTANTPLLRLAWNRQDPRFMSVLALDSPQILVLDIRFPVAPVLQLRRHLAAVNAVSWAPHSSTYLCSAGDDRQALIWDLSQAKEMYSSSSGSMGPNNSLADPILAYDAGAAINQLHWSLANPEWIAICMANKAQVLRV